MNRAIALLLCASLAMSTAACFSARPRAEENRSLLQEGMSKADVHDRLGDPDDMFRVPGQGDDPRLPVEYWRYAYQWTSWGIVAMILLFPFGMALSEWKSYRFDVGFGADGRVLRTTEVIPGK